MINNQSTTKFAGLIVILVACILMSQCDLQPPSTRATVSNVVLWLHEIPFGSVDHPPKWVRGRDDDTSIYLWLERGKHFDDLAPALREIYQSGSVGVPENQVLMALAYFGDSTDVPLFTNILFQGDANLRATAASALARTRDFRAAPALCHALRTDVDENVRANVCLALSANTHPDAKACLYAATNDRSAFVAGIAKSLLMGESRQGATNGPPLRKKVLLKISALRDYLK